MTTTVYFAIPGDINSLTGGYGYDRRLIAGLQDSGFKIQLIPLAHSFPAADSAALADAEARLAELPDGAIVIIDGLAFGVMDASAASQGQRLQLIALCHHPLAWEAGLSAQQIQDLQQSEKRALNAATAVVVTSPATANLLLQEFAIPEHKITVAVPGTDRQLFAACNNNPPLLLTVASLTQRKAHNILIDALASLAHLPWQARFVGGQHFSPDWAAYLKNKVAASGLHHRIHFIGSTADINAEYARADLFVLPSLFEGYGMAFAEALAFGLPIVAANSGALPDLVPATAGILVPPGDTGALASALQRLLTHTVERQQLQRGAQQAAQQLPDWKDTAHRVADLIRKLEIRSTTTGTNRL